MEVLSMGRLVRRISWLTFVIHVSVMVSVVRGDTRPLSLSPCSCARAVPQQTDGAGQLYVIHGQEASSPAPPRQQGKHFVELPPTKK